MLVLVKQIFTSQSFEFPEFVEIAYLAAVFCFAVVNQIDVWASDMRIFRKGERIILFWTVILAISISLHFFAAKPSPEELLDVWLGVLAIYIGSRISASLKLLRCNGKLKKGGQTTAAEEKPEC